MGQGNNRDVGSVGGQSVSAISTAELEERHVNLGFSGEQLQDEVWSDLTANIVLEDTYDALALKSPTRNFKKCSSVIWTLRT